MQPGGRFGVAYRSAVCRDGPFGRRYYTIIYAIDAPDIGRIKFGKTSNLEKRFSGISNMAPCPLKLIGHSWLPDEAEAAIFHYLAADRCHGEWFMATERVRSIAALVGSQKVVELAHEVGMTRMLVDDVPSAVAWGRR